LGKSHFAMKLPLPESCLVALMLVAVGDNGRT
jgi:hypothetical protein